MDPPAPVTRIRFPAKYPATEATSVCTGLRPSRSLIRGSRTPSMRATPLSNSVIDGITLGTSPHRSACAVRSRIAVPLARAMAMTSTVAPVLAAACSIAVRSPRTGTPNIRSLRLAGSSSRNATGRYSESGCVTRLCANWVPAAPAPNTMIFTAVAADAGVRMRCRTANRM